MKKQHVFILSALFASLFVTGQTGTSAQETVDTVYAYDVTTEIAREGRKKVSYVVNGEPVTKAEMDKILAANKKRSACNPCYLINLNREDEPVSSGLYLYDCKPAEYDTLIGEDYAYASVAVTRKACKEGEWLFYDADGNVTETKFFVKDKEVKGKAKRD